jgi:integrase/recombinase XerD
MPIRLDTVLKKVEDLPNRINSDLLKDFYRHMKDNGTSQNYQKGNLKFLDTKVKPEQVDPDKKWITTWNDYLWRLKLFFRWLYNKKIIRDIRPLPRFANKGSITNFD